MQTSKQDKQAMANRHIANTARPGYLPPTCCIPVRALPLHGCRNRQPPPPDQPSGQAKGTHTCPHTQAKTSDANSTAQATASQAQGMATAWRQQPTTTPAATLAQHTTRGTHTAATADDLNNRPGRLTRRDSGPLHALSALLPGCQAALLPDHQLGPLRRRRGLLAAA